jgi:hypothetical protein
MTKVRTFQYLAPTGRASSRAARNLAAALAGRTGLGLHERVPMTMAGWAPWLMDTLDPGDGRATFGTYVRHHSVLLRPSEASRV